jgi:hypothetical protein
MHDIQQIAAVMKTEKYKDGDLIITQGDQADCMCVISSCCLSLDVAPSF